MLETATRYETEAEVREAVDGRLLRHRAPASTKQEWKRFKPDGLDIQLPCDQVDIADCVADILAARSPQQPRHSYGALYTPGERQRSEEISHERAKGAYVTRRVTYFRKEHWGSVDPPFKDADEARPAIALSDDIVRFLSPFSLSSEPRVEVVPFEFFDSAGPFTIFRRGPVNVRRGSFLGSLKYLADAVAEELDCFPAQAVNFVLTGDVPEVMPVTADVDLVLDRLHLRINYPWVSAATILRVYRIMSDLKRRAILHSAHGRLSETPTPTTAGDRVVRLMEFAADTDGENWDARWRVWNQRYPEWSYKSCGSMQTSYSQARQRFAGLAAVSNLMRWERDGYLRLSYEPQVAKMRLIEPWEITTPFTAPKPVGS